MSIRIIYSYNTEKSVIEYNIFKSIIKEHELFVYNGLNDENFKNLKKVKYNIYIDVIPEDAYLNIPCDITILIVNDLYINEDIYLRREYYKRTPLIKIDDIVNYFICITEYSYKILLKRVNNNKVLFFNIINYYLKNNILKNNILKNILIKERKEIKKNQDFSLFSNNYKSKYILYEIDPYSNIENIIILKLWEKYFINSDKILIIKYTYFKENIIKYFFKISKLKKNFNTLTYIYKNIILTIDNIYINSNDIGCYIINCSYYNLVINLYNTIINNKAIINNKIIITQKNKISNDILKNNAIYFNKFTELELKKCLDKYLDIK
jgi:hypothetical protein